MQSNCNSDTTVIQQTHQTSNFRSFASCHAVWSLEPFIAPWGTQAFRIRLSLHSAEGICFSSFSHPCVSLGHGLWRRGSDCCTSGGLKQLKWLKCWTPCDEMILVDVSNIRCIEILPMQSMFSKCLRPKKLSRFPFGVSWLFGAKTIGLSKEISWDLIQCKRQEPIDDFWVKESHPHMLKVLHFFHLHRTFRVLFGLGWSWTPQQGADIKKAECSVYRVDFEFWFEHLDDSKWKFWVEAASWRRRCRRHGATIWVSTRKSFHCVRRLGLFGFTTLHQLWATDVRWSRHVWGVSVCCVAFFTCGKFSSLGRTQNGWAGSFNCYHSKFPQRFVNQRKALILESKWIMRGICVSRNNNTPDALKSSVPSVLMSLHISLYLLYTYSVLIYCTLIFI